MAAKKSEIDARKYLAAFADGELDVQDSLRVLEHMAMNPEATRRVMHQQQLKQIVGETILKDAPKAPGSLRELIEDIADDSERSDEPRTVLARLRPWALAGVAALLAIAASVLYLPEDGAGWRYMAQIQQPQGPQEELLDISFANNLAKRHVTCTRMIEDMGNVVQFPEHLEAMPDAISTFLNVDKQHCPKKLDLTRIGYRYAGARPCSSTGGLRSVHMIYRPVQQDGPQDAISLWILPDSEQYDLTHMEEGRVYKVLSRNAPHPLVAWRMNGMTYFLMGDSDIAVETAADALVISI